MTRMQRFATRLWEDAIYLLIACVALSFLGAYLALRPAVGDNESEQHIYFLGLWAVLLVMTTVITFLLRFLLTRFGTKSSAT